MKHAWQHLVDRGLNNTLDRLDRWRPAVESTRIPGSRAWIVERTIVNLLTLAITGGLAALGAWAMHRWTPVHPSAVWVGFAGASLVMIAMEVRAMRRAQRGAHRLTRR